MTQPAHYPVMLNETVEYLNVKPDGVYLDATAGLGGHTGPIARRLTSGFVIANDRDAASLEVARRNTADVSDRIRFHQGSFSELRDAVTENGVEQVDGVVADLGVSRYQLTTPERGFSVLADGPLDMRMDQSHGRSAADLVNHTAEKALADMIFQLGEERRARKLARAIVRARPIRSTRHLADVVERAAPRTGKLHPATKTFMALRMAVNDEPGELDQFLDMAPELTKPQGRIVCISFMSLEDRKVKEKFRTLGRESRAKVLTKHPARPSEDEVRENPASRSAKLRALEMN
ncbi:MAG: 16S rRNA (cytosine(1402)-N(4))-methyltransferase RsmH [Bryobacteraceae bacterium]